VRDRPPSLELREVTGSQLKLIREEQARVVERGATRS
jgi:hypothetical protein